jgi:4-hydroxy-3-polyprenylbenzoate decarboxylase
LPFDDLRQWIAALDRAGELRRIQTEVDPILEIAEITDRISKMHMCEQPLADSVGTAASAVQPSGARRSAPGGPALLFQNLKGHPNSQLLINQFGSESRMKLALGVNSLDEIAARIRLFMDVKSPQGFLDKLKMLPLLAEASKFFPKTVPTGPCKEVIKRDNFSLLDFPILQCWPQDAGRFITLPCVITRDPNTGKRNVGMYRLQVYDARTLGAHWQQQKIAAEHYRESLRRAASATTKAGTPPKPSFGLGGDFDSGTNPALNPPKGRGSAAVDIMARSSGGSVLADGDRPSGKMEVAVRNRRPRSPCRQRNRPRRLRQSRRTPHRGPLRRPHRLLLPRRSLSRPPRHLHHPPQRAHLRHNDCRQAPTRRRLHG